MKTKESNLIFCDTCDKATYSSGVRYHLARCAYIASGYDCCCLENDNLFCGCETK